MGDSSYTNVDLREDIKRYAKSGVFEILLSDYSTGNHIVWATSAYASYGYGYEPENQITISLITGTRLGLIKTRAEKAREDQVSLTRSFAEVFTPTWVCKKMIDMADEERGWDILDHLKAKRAYIKSTCLEITCGEAPFVVNRYDASDGSFIPVAARIGILDRKLAKVKEITKTRNSWKSWAVDALKSVYGYEYQGDNLLIARINLLRTMEEAIEDAGWHPLSTLELKRFAQIVSRNFWQMDGLNYCVPFKALGEVAIQPSLFDLLEPQEDGPEELHETVYSKIFNWKTGTEIEFRKLGNGSSDMKFDFVIGNPPYQEEQEGDNKTYAPPVYHYFMDGAYTVGEKVELISPARFLFDAGSTPKAWNKKMLKDPHLKVLEYEADSSKIFPNQDIKGGIVITYRDKDKDFGAIEHFIAYEALRGIFDKVRQLDEKSLSSIIYAAESYKFTDQMHADYPYAEKLLSKGHKFDLKTSVLKSLDDIVFFETQRSKSDVRIIGLIDGKRAYRWINRCYIKPADNFDSFKIILPKSNGSGALGEVLSTPLIGAPLIGHTQSFISVGKFETEEEAQAAFKYIKSKFARVMLGILKVTQDNPGPKWKYVPLQDFTSKSDIDWSQSVAEIDQQLYKKYGLTPEEIEFIETHVQEMK